MPREAASQREGAIDRACEGDRLWFECHPGRDVRIRPLMAGECLPLDDPSGQAMVLVRQLRPGVRVRSFLPIVGGDGRWVPQEQA
jgi:hypothetical protein